MMMMMIMITIMITITIITMIMIISTLTLPMPATTAGDPHQPMARVQQARSALQQAARRSGRPTLKYKSQYFASSLLIFVISRRTRPLQNVAGSYLNAERKVRSDFQALLSFFVFQR